MGLSHRLDKKDNKIVFISNDCHPQTIEVVKTRSEPLGLEVVIGNDEDLSNISEDIICGILQYPGTLGDIKDPSENISKIKKRNNQIDKEPFKNIKEVKNRLINPTRENVK